jgi:hypothetical protein
MPRQVPVTLPQLPTIEPALCAVDVRRAVERVKNRSDFCIQTYQISPCPLDLHYKHPFTLSDIFSLSSLHSGPGPEDERT